jgi:23S rRNA (uracil1939-C5)-methyltransferase
MQVNSDIKDKIYDFAGRSLAGAKLIIDAYSGGGLMTAIMSKIADHVVGLEIVKSATLDADALKHNNNIVNMQNINCDCVVGFDKVAIPEESSGFYVILDPPRKGADQLVLNKLISKKPEKILYISCNPATLARDLKTLAQEYVVESVTPYDMFPNTAEIETVALLKLKK